MAKVIGYGHAKPTNIVTNKDLESVMETTDEWIKTRTGIEQRNIHTGNMVDLAVDAARNAIADSGIDKDKIDFVICSTNSPDDASVATSARVAEALELKSPGCVDTNSACTGFATNMTLTKGMLDSGLATNILVISAEMLSRSLDWNDRSTAVLFGDGAGAVVVTGEGKQKIFDVKMNSKPSGIDNLDIPLEYRKTPFSEGQTPTHKSRSVVMNGHAVFNFAVRSVAKSLKEITEKNNITFDDIKYIVPHQANVRILQQIAKKLKFDDSKFYVNINRWGNTSSATIPICLSEMKRDGLIKEGDKIILTGFGGGLTYGSIYMEV